MLRRLNLDVVDLKFKAGDILKFVYKILVAIIFLFAINIFDVSALTIKNAGVGVSGEGSSGCNTGRCGNTIGLNIGGVSFSNTAIYGMRVTIVDKDENVIKTPINFWANQSMKNIVANSSIKKTSSYSNDVYTANNNKLYNWASGGLRSIDTSNKTYAQFIDSLNEIDINFILSKFNINTQDAFGKNYIIKIEPIFVLHFLIDGNHYYFQGTAREIINMVYVRNNFRSQTDYDYAVFIINLSDSGNTWNVLRNYLLTTYLKERSSDVLKKFDIWDDPNASTKTMYDKIREGSGKGLSVGYLWVDDFKSKYTSVVVTKRFGKKYEGSKLNNDVYTCFQLLRKGNAGKYDIFVSDGRTYLCNHPSASVLSPSVENYNLKFNQVEFKNVLTGEYIIREINIPNDILNTRFYQRTDTVGDYSIDLGTRTPTNFPGYGRVAASNSFTISDTSKKYYFVAVNAQDDNNNLQIIKHFMDPITKNSINTDRYAKFEILKKNDSGGYDSVGVNSFKKYYTFLNLESGTYKVKEVGIPSDVEKVTFEIVDNDVYSPVKTYENIINNEVESDEFTLNGFHRIKIIAKNYLREEMTCEKSLKLLKKDLCGGENSNSCSKGNKYNFINGLWELYNEYESDDNNKLFNYKFENDGSLNIKDVACENVSCSVGSNDEFTCNQGNVKSSSPSSSDVENRVCYIGNNSYLKHDSTGSFYNEDLDAYCTVSYEYNTGFKSDQNIVDLQKNSVLWRKVKSPGIGNLTLKIHCEGIYGIDTNLDNYKLDSSKFINNFLPSFKIAWWSKNGKGRFKFKQDLNLISSNSTSDLIPPNVDSQGNFKYATWDSSYNYVINYTDFWHTNGIDGKFVSKNKKTTQDGYKFRGFGLPIALNDSVGDKDAFLSIVNNNAGYDYEITCPYKVKKSGDNPGDDEFKFNFNFRVIDVNNPFPGIDGDGRLVGDNWCLDSRVGKTIYLKDKSYVVGDLIDKDDYVGPNEFPTNFSNFNITDNPEADIDGDGVITNLVSTSCSNDYSDYCILMRKLRNGDSNISRDLNCQSDPEKNNFVKRYITEDNVSNSDSTGEPMYSFTVTPSDIKSIRQYNKKHAYNDFEYTCDDQGNYCISQFLTNIINNTSIDSGISLSSNFISNNSRCYSDRSRNISDVSKKWCINHN